MRVKVTEDRYTPGDEDVDLQVSARDDGMVSLAVTRTSDGARIWGIVLSPATARSMAEKLSLASWRAEGVWGAG